MTRVLLFGAEGMLAQDVLAEAPEDASIVAKRHADADVTDEPAVRSAIQEANPDVIINCAAYTNVDGAEAAQRLAFLVNGEAPGIIGRASPKVLVVHFSTDYVFDGAADHPYREDDATAPLGAYGASKLAGERALVESGARYLILRTSWLFGLHGNSFPRTMWQRATEGKATRVVRDQVGRPTYTVDLARATWKLLAMPDTARGRGTALHVTNAGRATWYDVAERVFERAGAAGSLSECTTAEYPTPARRPAYSVLDTSAFEKISGAALPPWQDAVNRFLGELQDECD